MITHEEKMFGGPATAMNDQSASQDQTTEGDSTEGEATATLPTSILEGNTIKEGDSVTLKVVKVYPDEFEVAYAHPSAETDSSGQESSPDDQLDALAKE